MFFGAGRRSIQHSERHPVYIAHISVCEQTKKTPFGVFLLNHRRHGWAGLCFRFYIRNCEALWLYSVHRRSGGVQLSNKRPGLFGLFALCVDHVLRGTRGEGLVGQLGLDALEVLLRLFALGGDAPSSWRCPPARPGAYTPGRREWRRSPCRSGRQARRSALSSSLA